MRPKLRSRPRYLNKKTDTTCFGLQTKAVVSSPAIMSVFTRKAKRVDGGGSVGNVKYRDLVDRRLTVNWVLSAG